MNSADPYANRDEGAPLRVRRPILPARSARSIVALGAGTVAAYGNSWLFFVGLALLIAVATVNLFSPSRIEASNGILSISSRVRVTAQVPVAELGQPVLLNHRFGSRFSRLMLRTRTAHVLDMTASVWRYQDLMLVAQYLDAAEVMSDEQAGLDLHFPGAVSWRYRHRMALTTVIVLLLAALALLGFAVARYDLVFLGWPW